MAYSNDPNDKKNQAGEDQPDTNAAPTTSSAPGGGPAPSGGSTSPQSPQSAPVQPFQNLQSYLTANQPQVQAQANKMTGELTNQYGQLQSSVDQGKNDFNKQVQGGYAQDNPDIINNAAVNPTDFVSNPENIKAFQSLYNDQYTGPSNYESSGAYGDLSGKINKASEEANLVNSTGGLKTYFQGKNQNSTAGGNTLDSVLLQGTPEAYKQVQSAAKPFSSLNDYLNQSVTEADKGVTEAQAEANRISGAAQNKFVGEGGLVPTLKNQLTDRLTQTKAGQTDAISKAIFDFQGGGATAEELALLGFNASDMSDQALSRSWKNAQNLKNDYGVDTNWNAMFNPQSADVAYSSPGSVATPEEVSRTKALGSLTGQDLMSFLGNTSHGPMAQRNDKGLGDLGTNLNARDESTLLNNASHLLATSDFNGGAAPDMETFISTMDKKGLSPKTLYDYAVQRGDKALIGAVSRLIGTGAGTSVPPQPPLLHNPKLPLVPPTFPKDTGPVDPTTGIPLSVLGGGYVKSSNKSGIV